MADRPEFKSVYEEQEADIRDRMLSRISDDWRKKPGDFVYDTVATSPLEVKQLQIGLDQILKNAFAQYAEGSFLDYLMNDIGMTRKGSTPNQRTLNVTADSGVVIPAGQLLNTVILDNEGDPLEYTVDEKVEFTANETKAVKVTCNTDGTVGNIATGSDFIFQPSIGGIKQIIDQGSDILGTDTEDDPEAYDRYEFKVNHPDTGGNRNDYIRWIQEIPAVGDQRILPLWRGNGTVKAVIIDTEYQPATETLVDEVQEYLDPKLDTTKEAETMLTDGYGVTVNADNAELAYDSQGDGILYYDQFGGLEDLLETQNHFKARVQVKVDSNSGTNDLLKIEVRDRGTLTPVYETDAENNQAVKTLTAADLSTSYGYVELPFYWDGLQPIEIAVTRLTTDTTTLVTVDNVNFISLYGQALGEGKAPAGAMVYVISAIDLPIDITAVVDYSEGYDQAEVEADFKDKVENYLVDLAFSDKPVVYNKIGSLLIETTGVSNYSDLTINGGTTDIMPGKEEVATLGTVTI